MELTATDRFELQDVMLRYTSGVDERDFDLYRSCFADHAEMIGFAPDPVVGADVWLAFVERALEPYSATQHLLGPQLARVVGDSAHARTDVQALHFLKDPPGTTFTLWATYETDFERIGGSWKITRHRLIPRGSRKA